MHVASSLVLFSIFALLLIFLAPTIDAAIVQQQQQQAPSGIDAEEGDAELFFNKTYTEHLTALQQKIFRGYQVKKRPVRNESQPTIVNVHWHIVHISINQLDQTMTIHGHVYMKWYDEFLVWDPKDFNGVRTVRCKKWQVWQPKVKVANSASGVNSAFDFSTNAHVHIHIQDKDKSKVEMYPTFSIKVGCSFDFGNFPNDINNCSMSMFPPAPMTKVQLKTYYQLPPTLSFSWGDQEDITRKKIISDFEILNVTSDQVYYTNGDISNLAPLTANELATTWSMLMTTVKFKRHSPFFTAAIGMPCIIISVINVMSFLIPSLIFSCYVLMANMFVQIIFLQDMIAKIPLSVSRVPDSVKIYSFIMLTNTISLLAHFVFIFLSSPKCSKPIPDVLKHIFVVKDVVVPNEWRRQPKSVEDHDSWIEWIKVVRPIIAGLLAIFYFVEILVFIIF